MTTAYTLIDSFISIITQAQLINDSCRAIRAYEGGKLPVPIRKTYFSFSPKVSRQYYSFDENGGKLQNDEIVISVKTFIPLSLSPASIYTLTESVINVLMKSNQNITAYSVGQVSYDSDVDAFRIDSELKYQTVKAL